jgi:hypothetical protein
MKPGVSGRIGIWQRRELCGVKYPRQSLPIFSRKDLVGVLWRTMALATLPRFGRPQPSNAGYQQRVDTGSGGHVFNP